MFVFPAVRCGSLTLVNGRVEFSQSPEESGFFSGDDIASGFFGGIDDTALYIYGTTARHSCDNGFILTVGDVERTCGNGNGVNGEWSGTAPVCQCMLYRKSFSKCLT